MLATAVVRHSLPAWYIHQLFLTPLPPTQNQPPLPLGNVSWFMCQPTIYEKSAVETTPPFPFVPFVFTVRQQTKNTRYGLHPVLCYLEVYNLRAKLYDMYTPKWAKLGRVNQKASLPHRQVHVGRIVHATRTAVKASPTKRASTTNPHGHVGVCASNPTLSCLARAQTAQPNQILSATS